MMSNVWIQSALALFKAIHTIGKNSLNYRLHGGGCFAAPRMDTLDNSLLYPC